MIPLEREAPADQEEIAASVAGRDAIHRVIVDRGGVDGRWWIVGREQERQATSQQKAVSGLDPQPFGFASHAYPAGAPHHGVEFNAFMGGELDSPFAARIETGADRRSGPQQGKNVG